MSESRSSSTPAMTPMSTQSSSNQQHPPTIQPHMQQQQQPPPKPKTMPRKIKEAWKMYEISLIKSAEASKVTKVHGHPVSSSSSSSTARYSTVEERLDAVKESSKKIIQTRTDLRNLLNEAEVNVQNKATELRALNLMMNSAGCCVGKRDRKRRKIIME